MAGTRISEDLTITGDLSCRGPVEVWGTINGDVVAASLAIMSGGRVEGKIQADALVVRGALSGTATCSSVEICKEAVIDSAITSKTLACEAGATIFGKFEVGREAPPFGSAEPGSGTEPVEVA